MKVHVSHGNSRVELPDAVAENAMVLRPNIPRNNSSAGAVTGRFQRAMLSPVAGPRLKDAARGGKRACVVVSDKTRRYGVDIWLSALIDELNAAGIPDEAVTVLFATGAHEQHDFAERAAIVGPEVAVRVRMVDHDCDAEDDLVPLGTTKAGTPVRINRIIVESDVVVTTGAVMPHYYAGFSGGRKSIVPGVAARDTIFANHSLNLAMCGGTEKRARTVVLEGNPVHEDLLEAASFVDVTFSVQAVCDASGNPAAFFTGGQSQAHSAACSLAAQWYCVSLDRPLPWVVASCGGFPKDINLYQSHKSLDNAFRAVGRGGTIFLIAKCRDGLGPEGFASWFNYPDTAAVEEKLREKFEVMGHTALRTMEKVRAARVFLMSDLPETIVMRMGMIPVWDLADIPRAINVRAARGAVMPHASLTVPLMS